MTANLSANKIGQHSVLSDVAKRVSSGGLFSCSSIRSEYLCRQLREYFRTADAVSPDTCYKSAYGEFTRRYLVPNMVKNYELIRDLQQLGLIDNIHNVVDLGAGPGSFALALLWWMHQQNAQHGEALHVVQTDVVEEFHSCFSALWSSVNSDKKQNLRVSNETACVDREYLDKLGVADLVVFSNSLVEILRGGRVGTAELLQAVARTGAILCVVDYEYETAHPIFANFAEAAETGFRSVHLGRGEVRHGVFEALEPSLPEPEGRIQALSELRTARDLRFLRAILLPKAGTGATRTGVGHALVDMYKLAWENHDVSLLARLFTTDAIYVEKKGQTPFRGLSEICRYWQTNAEQQARVRFVPQKVQMTRNELHVEWKASFYRKDQRCWVYLDGQFWASVRGRQIAHFTEEFRKKRTDRPIPLGTAGSERQTDGISKRLG